MRGQGLTVEILRVALGSIRSNKLRSGLTMLGIVIGIGAVITMVALGEGAQAQVEEQIASMGTDVLTVQPGSGWFGRDRNRGYMTVEDAERVAAEAGAVAAVAPRMDASYQVEFGRVNGNFRIIGTSPSYLDVSHSELAMGRFFTEEENQGRRRVAVLGSAIPEALGVEPVSLLNQHVLIRNIRFEVVGIMEERGAGGGGPGPSQDDQVFVPLSTAQFRLMGTERIGSFEASVAPGAPMDVATLQIEEALRRAHRLRPGDENDFWIQNRTDLLTTFQETSQTFTLLLAGIAAVSLLVGGIGIMNIMLVSVSERTKEIGLRKSLGARRRDILIQFLAEALVLCIVGGILGVLLAMGAAELASRTTGWAMAVPLDAVLLAVAFSAGVGLFFGIWPARRAAVLDPIDALRYE